MLHFLHFLFYEVGSELNYACWKDKNNIKGKDKQEFVTFLENVHAHSLCTCVLYEFAWNKSPLDNSWLRAPAEGLI